MSSLSCPPLSRTGEPRAAAVSTPTVTTSLFVSDPGQWLSTTCSRVTRDGYSWLQAVHWVASAGAYVPRRSHGPREFGTTTVRVAQVLAELTPCRPGVLFLARKLELSERTIEYQLSMLREAGLLAYVSKGGRVAGEGKRASEFVRVIPPVFDETLGIRTLGTGPGRRPVGMAKEGRRVIGRLAAAAARKVRRRRRRASKSVPTPGSSGPGRCTPMVGSSWGLESAGTTSVPPENNTDGGKPEKNPVGGKSARRGLNLVGRRYRLAAELVRRVPWLQRASVPRIAWVIRDVADAGWSCDDVLAWLHIRGAADHVRRPSGLLATLLATALKALDTEVKRKAAVEQWRDSRRAALERHAEWEGPWRGPSSHALSKQVSAAANQVRASQTAPALAEISAGQEADVASLSKQEVLDLRAAAAKDHELVLRWLDFAGEHTTRRVFTNGFVDDVLRLRGAGHLVLHGGAR